MNVLNETNGYVKRRSDVYLHFVIVCKRIDALNVLLYAILTFYCNKMYLLMRCLSIIAKDFENVSDVAENVKLHFCLRFLGFSSNSICGEFRNSENQVNLSGQTCRFCIA